MRVIGVDAGGTKLLGGVLDDGLVVHNRVRRTWRGGDTTETLAVLVDAVEEARRAAPDAAAVGLGIPSLVHAATGTSMSSVHLPLDGVPVRDLMSERLGLPVHVDNDATAAVLAEHRHGAARGASDVAMLTLGTGIGGGLVLGGRVYRGHTGAGGELGHMVVALDGPPCPCGSRGCLETLVSGTAIAREGAAAGRRAPESALGRALGAGREITGPLVTELAHDGDEAAREVLALAGRRLGVGITNIVNALDPELVVVGGGAAAAGDLLLEPARAEVRRLALPPSSDLVRVVPAHFGDESGMVGAGLLALEGGAV